MLKLNHIRVRSFDLDYLDLTWETEPQQASEDPLNYTFQVLRSEADTGPYENVSRTFSDKYRFRDSTVSQNHPARKWFYRIRVTRTSDSAYVDHPSIGGATLEAEPDLEALEASRQIQIRLNEFTGRDVYLLPRRTFGQRCTACFDHVMQVARQGSCLTCFDTTYVGGYHTPVKLVMGITLGAMPAPSQDQNVRRYTRTARGLLSNYPEITEGSVVVETENIRWVVAGPVELTYKLRAVVRQRFNLVELPHADVAYKFYIKESSPETLEPTPIRQYSNPTDPAYIGFRGGLP